MNEKKLRAQNAINYLIYKGVADTQKEIGDKLGYGESYFSQIISGGKSLSDSVLRKIAELDKGKDLNLNWLLTGEGEMLVDESGVQDRELENPIDPSKGVRYYPNIPITASHLENMPNPSYEDMQYEVMSIRGFEGCIAFPAVGDSMYPRISNGDIVMFKEWTENYISNGDIYLIVTRNGDRTLKYLTHISTDENGVKHFLCKSANPDQDRFAPFEILGDDIVSLFVVYGCIKRFKM